MGTDWACCVLCIVGWGGVEAVKDWKCRACGKQVEVEDDYEPQMCCSGRDCGCMGMEVNPVFCDECEEKIFGKREGKPK